MAYPLEIPLDVCEDENGEFYVSRAPLPALIANIRVVAPDSDGSGGKLIIVPVEQPSPTKAVFLEEVRRAERHFSSGTGYVGIGYFLTHWKSPRLPFGADLRQLVVEELIEDGDIEVYEAHDGKDAIRVT